MKYSHKNYLLNLKAQEFDYDVTILASDDACSACKSLDGNTYRLDEALRKMPLPCKDCERKMCRCLYTAEAVRR